MYKILFFLLTISLIVSAEDKVEIFATRINSNNTIIHASGDIAVVYKEYYLTASRAIYNKSTGELELFHNVKANQNDQYRVLGNYAKLNIKNKERSFEPFYMLEKKSQVWLSADKGEIKNKDLSVASGVVSSCEPENPLWQMEFTESDYNMDSKWMNLYNATLYIADIPIFYTPWFGYPLDKTRRTGLLKPELGYSSSEGVYYQQPIYIAEQDWWDLEINPQIRTRRGAGIYSTFRFADSNVSEGSFSLGYFKEKNDYFKNNNLDKKSHNGWGFDYKNNNFLNQWFALNLEGQSGIYADINYISDVDFINLSSSNGIETETSMQVLSRINAFYNTESDYLAAYFKYYQDLSLENNDNTLQHLPTIQYHHYLETMFDDHLSYNIDLQADNIHREKNTKAVQTTLNIPVSLHTSLFDEYLDVSFKTYLYGQYTSFSGSLEDSTLDQLENGYILKSDHIIDISTQLTKAYTDFSHVISFGMSYSFDGAETTNGYYKNNENICQNILTMDNEVCEFFDTQKKDNEYKFDFTQYLYDTHGKQILYHRMSQVILNDTEKTLGDLENEIEYNITDNLVFYNNLFYNYDENKFSKIYTKLSYSTTNLRVALSHMYKDSFLPKTNEMIVGGEYIPAYTPYTNYLTSSLSYKYDSHYSYYFAYDYDIELDIRKRLEYGFLYKKRCWDFGVRFAENNRPVLREGGQIDNIRDKYIYFTVALKPFMRSDKTPFFAYKLKNDNEDDN